MIDLYENPRLHLKKFQDWMTEWIFCWEYHSIDGAVLQKPSIVQVNPRISKLG